jgi:aryl-alcohol dehydrogenase-like predicted oxidoreductase
MMMLRTLGNSDIKVTPLAFGAWAIGGWMWGGAKEKEALRAIRASYDEGITTIDTAPAYGFGKSESLIGEALVGVPRDKYQLLTKFGMNWETHDGTFHFDTVNNEGKPIKMYRYAAPKQVIRECEESLKRLRTDYVDLLQIHWPDPTTPISDTMEAVAKLMKDGKVRAAGVCNYSVEQVEEALTVVPLVSNQVPYSMINRGIEKTLVSQALAKGMAIIPYSPLQRGLLTGKIKPGYKFNEGDSRQSNKFYSDENIKRVNALLERIRPIAEVHNASLSQVVINWTTRRPAMQCVLVGARDEAQVKDNARSLSFILSDDEINTITTLADEFQLAD